jgi:hypothetical protein
MSHLKAPQLDEIKKNEMESALNANRRDIKCAQTFIRKPEGKRLFDKQEDNRDTLTQVFEPE